jgi:hypothetical protein
VYSFFHFVVSLLVDSDRLVIQKKSFWQYKTSIGEWMYFCLWDQEHLRDAVKNSLKTCPTLVGEIDFSANRLTHAGTDFETREVELEGEFCFVCPA